MRDNCSRTEHGMECGTWDGTQRKTSNRHGVVQVFFETGLLRAQDRDEVATRWTAQQDMFHTAPSFMDVFLGRKRLSNLRFRPRKALRRKTPLPTPYVDCRAYQTPNETTPIYRDRKAVTSWNEPHCKRQLIHEGNQAD